jgi:hypothetical protein
LRSHASSGTGTISALTGSGTGVEDTWILVSFATPTTNPTPGTDLQGFRVLVRKTDTANPTVDIALYEDGAFVATLVSGTSVTSDTGQVVTATWDAALLSDPTGADVECYVYGHSNGVSQVEIGAIAWDVAQGFTGSGAGTVAALTGSGTGLRSHASTGAGTITAATGAGTGTSEGPQTWTGSGAGTFPALAGTGTGLRGAKGSGTGTIAVTGTGTGDSTGTWIGSGAAVLGIVVGAGMGTRSHAGSGAGTIDELTGSGGDQPEEAPRDPMFGGGPTRDERKKFKDWLKGLRTRRSSGKASLPALTADGEGFVVRKISEPFQTSAEVRRPLLKLPAKKKPVETPVDTDELIAKELRYAEGLEAQKRKKRRKQDEEILLLM